MPLRVVLNISFSSINYFTCQGKLKIHIHVNIFNSFILWCIVTRLRFVFFAFAFSSLSTMNKLCNANRIK